MITAVVYGRGSVESYVKGLGVAVGGVAVTPSDTQDMAFTARALYVGTAGATGTVKVKAANGDVIVFVGLAAGSILPVAVLRVYATGTDASNIVALK